jgi:hypothetical protein
MLRRKTWFAALAFAVFVFASMSAERDASASTYCAAGQFAGGAGGTTVGCHDCPSGTSSSGGLSADCHTCDAGTYSTVG